MARQSFTYFNGEWHEGDVPILSASSHGTWLGSVVFDGARLFDGVTPDLDRHCERVNASAEALLLAPTMSSDDIVALSLEGLKKFSPGTDVYIKPLYWAEESDAGIITPEPTSTNFALHLFEVPMVAPTGFTLTTTRFRRPTLEVMPVNAKASALYANNARMVREAQSRGFQNALVCDANGNVAETATSNVFMVRDGEVFTPIANGTFLNGITRQRVIGLMQQDGIKVHETTLTIDDFHQADEIFTSGNISKVVPCIKFEDRDFQIGPMATKARELYMSWAHQ